MFKNRFCFQIIVFTTQLGDISQLNFVLRTAPCHHQCQLSVMFGLVSPQQHHNNIIFITAFLGNYSFKLTRDQESLQIKLIKHEINFLDSAVQVEMSNLIKSRCCLYSNPPHRCFVAIFNHYGQVVTGTVTAALLTELCSNF